MKSKRIFCLAALLLPAVISVYAQDLKFNGYFNSGLGVVYSDSVDVDTFLKAFGVDSEQNGYRFRLNGSYTHEDGNAGIRFRFQSQSRLNQGGYFSLPYIYGWVKLFNDVVYLAGGIVDDSTWQTTDWYIIDDVGEGLGALLKVTPVAGLDLGIGAYIISQQAAGSNNILNSGGFLPNFGSITPKIEDVKYVYSASYTLTDIFRLGATFRWKNKAGWNGTIDFERYGYVYDGRQESAQLFGELRFLMVKDLTAIVAASLDCLEEFDIKGNIVISQTFAYKLGSLTLGLNAAEFLYNRKGILGNKIKYDPGLLFNLWGSYAINNITPRLDLVYFTGGMSKVGGDETYMWHRRGYANRQIYEIGSDNEQNRSVFSIRPSVKFNINSSTFIEIGNIFNYDFGNFDGAYGNSADFNKRELISNVFYIDFGWSF
ncbi:MAG: hypothetical protein LBI28_05400 [Treponema sp.]|jgi:hypothetical protein|nr:hypothetical protein [Treponema sp.]